nr:ATP-binding protein [uncultured Desulfobacter sp.]
MNHKTNAQEKFHRLRKQAEIMMANKTFPSTPPVVDDPLKLIHELQTFQIELELQNEELQRSQQELMETQIKYTRLYDFAPVGYLTIGFNGMILNANLTLADMLAIERSSLIDQSLSVHIVSEDQDIFYQHLRRLADEKTRQVCELRMKKTDAAPFYAQLESTVMSYQIGNPGRYRTVVIDISERKKMEKEQEHIQKQLFQAHKMTAIATMAGGIAHDFNNILFIIIGNVEFLMEDFPEWKPSDSKLNTIKTAALRAAGIVKMLLSFSFKTDQEKRPIDVSFKINETFKLLRSLIPSTINIRTIVPDTDVMILADVIQFGQILINLCTNAAQAMEETGGSIEIKLETQFLEQGDVEHYPALKAGAYAKISVCDTGPGIDPEIMSQIFDPYFTTRDVGKGSGMGLAVVHGIVKNHDGAVTVTGKPGQGACFTIFFPVIDQKPEIKAAPPV